MTLRDRFLFAPEPGDPPHVVAQLARFQAMGGELGAIVEVFGCALHPEHVRANFSWPDGRTDTPRRSA